MTVASPCVDICRIDGRTGWCEGCGRTLGEIEAWPAMSPYRRTALLRDLPRRMARLAARPAAAEPT